MNPFATQRIKMDTHIYHPRGLEISWFFLFFPFFYRILIFLWIKNFLICQKTDFCFTNAKIISITFMKTVDKIIHVRKGMNILAKHVITLFYKISPPYQVVWAHYESK